MEFLSEYGIFLAKAVTVVIAILLIIAAAGSAASRNKSHSKKEMKIEKVNERLEAYRDNLEHMILDKEALKAREKAEKKKNKAEKKSRKQQNDTPEEAKPRVYVIDFEGDIKASAVDTFREAVTTVLQVVDKDRDEVVVRLESPGGMVHSYGLAAAQLDRFRKAGVKLTACVDKVAASGGYMMACVADKIVASPFAIMGSIGVVAQLPNFHRLLKKHDIDFEVLTAGEHKRTLTVFGENTEKGRQKFLSDLEDTHQLFKSYVAERRPAVDIEKVATGDIWFGQRALDVSLVDELCTSDEYLMLACQESDVFEVEFKEKQGIADKLGIAVSQAVEKSVARLLSQFQGSQGFK
ncbi:MAG: protease SohB [Oleiphilus sp.]|nr:MAG: protease SohB [Oleiphilus sp.]